MSPVWMMRLAAASTMWITFAFGLTTKASRLSGTKRISPRPGSASMRAVTSMLSPSMAAITPLFSWVT